ncbi:MAG: potassium-transporting ATPase subunit KdpC [Deltaproteobacteria bacterium]|nr:potassium-transporting ATPase subunit KdpC [Deltaproteobacteria bacterium]
MNQLKPAVLSLVMLTLVTGVAYPLAVTGIAQVLFPFQANGSLIARGDAVVGSTLVGQPFDDPKYFWSRPSATGPMAYNGAVSSGSNLGPLSDDLTTAVQGRIEALRAADPGNTAPVPIDLVTASGSGLDPNISPAAARYQAGRVARIRNVPEAAVLSLVAQHTRGRQWGFFGEPVVDVLPLNLAVDELGTKQ